jgi:hypothetical protein
VIALLLIGAILWAGDEHAGNQLKEVGALKSLSIVHLIIIAASIAVAAGPHIRTNILARLERLRHPSLRAQRWTAAGVCGATIAYIAFTAWLQGRDLIPKFHDEHLLLVQVRLLSEFRLWAPQHPLADFFESFHIFVKPRYASVYFPGASLLYVLGVWLHLKFWMIPLLIAGLCAAFVYRITTELLDDGVAGLLAALMLVSLQWFRYLAMMVMSQNVLMLAGLLLIWTWLRWRKENKITWAMAIGAWAGWMATTRPVDALAYAIPVALAMLLDLRRLPLSTALKTAAVACLFAVPFVTLQIIENLGITGKPFETPYRLYADLYTPGIHFGFHDFDPSRRPQTNLPQRQIYYDQFTVPAVKAHRPERVVSIWLHERFPTLFEVTLPNRLFLVLIPLVLLGLNKGDTTLYLKGRVPFIVVGTVLVLYVVLYAGFAYLLPMYCVVVAPSVIVWVLLGKDAIERMAGRWRDGMTVALTLAIAGLTIASLPEIHRQTLDDGFAAPSMWFNYVELPRHVQTPAIVLYRFHPGENVNEEPVYNIDVVNPDDAPIIRAHDLGVERDRELFDYYAKRQPARTVYLYDRASHQLATLGNVAELSQRFPIRTRLDTTRPSHSD